MDKQGRNYLISQWYDEYYETLKRYCCSKLGYESAARDEIQDCIQSVFEIAIKKYDQASVSPNVGGWLMSTCVFVVKAKLKTLGKHKNNTAFSLNDELFHESEQNSLKATFNKWLEQVEAKEQIDTLQNSLNEREAAVIQGLFYEDKTEKQVADSLGVPTTTVKGIVYRIRKRLKSTDV